MKELTDYQLDILYQISDIHLDWFKKYSPESNITYEDVIKMNHQKLIDIVNSCDDCNDEVTNFIFESVLKNYRDLLDDYSI